MVEANKIEGMNAQTSYFGYINEDGKRHGFGCLVSNQGYISYYEGTFNNDMFEGYASIKYSNGEKYIGQI